MKYLIILMSLIATSCFAADTVWLETVDTMNHELLELREPVLVGDADNSGDIDIDDVVYLFEFIFQGGQSPPVYPSVQIRFAYTDSTRLVIENGVPIKNLLDEGNLRGHRFGEISGQEVDTL
jgi:hypothetical protein